MLDPQDVAGAGRIDRGKLELDMFISHPICDAARNLAAIWGRNNEYSCQILYLPQNPNSETQRDVPLRRVQRRLTRTGRGGRGHVTISPMSDLRRSIEVFNENRG